MTHNRKFSILYPPESSVLSKPDTKWETILTDGDDDTNFIYLIDDRRALVGTIFPDTLSAIPKYSNVAMYNISDGSKLWNYKLKGIPEGAEVLVTEPVILLAGTGNNFTLYTALNPDTGEFIWEHKLKVPAICSVSQTSNQLFFLSQKNTSGKIDALDMNTGNSLWRCNFEKDTFYAIQYRDKISL